MTPQYYSILHVTSILLLTGVTFAVFGGAPEARRKQIMMAGGILSLLALVGGFGLASKNLGMPNPMNWPAWIWVKVLCWLWLSAIGGIAFRRRAQTPRWMAMTAFALIAALTMVYLRPTFGG
ncbi:MAG: hypothetical protein IPL39_06325 [Opitutaceae bacterium]|nr:hypothetical protein [Opitutaceae bacterium]